MEVNKLELKLTKFEYERFVQEIMIRYEKEFSIEEQKFIEVLVLREIDKIRGELKDMIKEEIKIQLKGLK